MEFINLIVRPDTLENGKRYLLRVRHENGRRPAYVTVAFVGMTPVRLSLW